MRIMLADYVRVTALGGAGSSGSSSDDATAGLYSEKDLDRCALRSRASRADSCRKGLSWMSWAVHGTPGKWRTVLRCGSDCISTSQ
jgi:hypothetical protein